MRDNLWPSLVDWDESLQTQAVNEISRKHFAFLIKVSNLRVLQCGEWRCIELWESLAAHLDRPLFFFGRVAFVATPHSLCVQVQIKRC